MCYGGYIMQVKFILMGAMGAFVKPLSNRVVKSFPLNRDFRANVREYVRRFEVDIINLHTLNWNPYE
jgi:hypothetical protein